MALLTVTSVGTLGVGAVPGGSDSDAFANPLQVEDETPTETPTETQEASPETTGPPGETPPGESDGTPEENEFA